MNIADPIREELTPGEQVLWSGQPRQGIFLRSSDAVLIPFSLVWTGFAVFWMYGAATSGAPLFFVLFGTPFVLAGIYLVIGRYFSDARQRATTYYAVTTQRVLISHGGRSRQTKSLSLHALNELTLTTTADGRGSITFGATGPFGRPGRVHYIVPCFDLIDDARTVYELIRKAQAAA
ncbi:hypothetical protein IP84_03405 [beta proteobacterium AAP99]|nr:hypothetical protein IP84_03405 [beta proteobacterium AAP99]